MSTCITSNPGFVETDRTDAWDWRWSLALVIGFAVVVRLVFLGHDSLNHSEVGRVMRAGSATLTQLRWAPPLQYALLWAVGRSIGDSEFAMRLPSALSGIGCVVALFFLTRRYVDAWSGVCVAAVAACHAELVLHSRWVRESSLEVFIAVLVTWAGVAAYANLSRRTILIFLGVSVVAFGTMYTAPLIVFGWIVTLGFKALRDTQDRRRGFRLLCWGGAALIPIFLLWHWWLSGGDLQQGASETYGIAGGAWPVDYQVSTLLGWFVSHSYGALRYVLGVTRLYAPIDTLIAAYELLLIAAAVTLLWKRVPALVVATALMLIPTVVVGALRLWPYGHFFSMIFLVPVACIAIGCGLRRIAAQLGRSLPVVLLVLVCLANHAARALKHTVIYPSETEHLRPVLQYVDQHAQQGDGIFAYYAIRSVPYYWKRDDVAVLVQPTDDRGNIARFAERFDDFMADQQRVWFLFTHDWKSERQEWIDHLKRNYRLVDVFKIADASAHLFERLSHEAEASPRLTPLRADPQLANSDAGGLP